MATKRTRAPSNYDRGKLSRGPWDRVDTKSEARVGGHIKPQPNGCWLYDGVSDEYGWM